ncbi:CoxG family protein [Acuticoccus sp. I52.16.1]|uniref:CoxG family protein n=1 Tax=Acuticoccus sp. I52.16.1 TaxID=2928472 RepID=UPI001FCF8599|nr:carbon monoxide dehydrogenase subunit G [Acuticoccus sp. I52.16.1]UOM34986.1 carbon monoxide dehydrogenase subunit G [Acuticoccus sp. I52.16.1]
MELTGEHRIPAPRQVVWEALHDPEILRACITGCQSLEMADDGTMKAKVTAKVGPVKATFDADVEIVNENAPVGYTLQGEGKGGVAGFAKGKADVTLAEDGADTILTYAAEAKIGGKLAQLGSRLVDSTAKKYASDFFSCLSEKVGAGAAAESGADATDAGAEPVMPSAAPAPAEAPVPGATPAAAPIAPTSAPEVAQMEAAAAQGQNSNFLWAAVILAAVVVGALAYFYA